MSLLDLIVGILSKEPAVLASDFDGTFSTLVDRPDDAVPLNGAVESLRLLSESPGLTVVVISGRPHADLVKRVGPAPGVLLIGEHGNDMGDESSALSEVSDVVDLLAEVSDDLSGSFVEEKKQSVAFHYRNADETQADKAVERVRSIAGRRDLELIEGKKVIELTLADRNKGQALIAVANENPIVYFGDDITDETVFAVLGDSDVGVKVGDGDTRARHRVSGPEEVAELFAQIAIRLA